MNEEYDELIEFTYHDLFMKIDHIKPYSIPVYYFNSIIKKEKEKDYDEEEYNSL